MLQLKREIILQKPLTDVIPINDDLFILTKSNYIHMVSISGKHIDLVSKFRTDPVAMTPDYLFAKDGSVYRIHTHANIYNSTNDDVEKKKDYKGEDTKAKNKNVVNNDSKDDPRLQAYDTLNPTIIQKLEKKVLCSSFSKNHVFLAIENKKIVIYDRKLVLINTLFGFSSKIIFITTKGPLLIALSSLERDIKVFDINKKGHNRYTTKVNEKRNSKNDYTKHIKTSNNLILPEEKYNANDIICEDYPYTAVFLTNELFAVGSERGISIFDRAKTDPIFVIKTDSPVLSIAKMEPKDSQDKVFTLAFGTKDGDLAISEIDLKHIFLSISNNSDLKNLSFSFNLEVESKNANFFVIKQKIKYDGFVMVLKNYNNLLIVGISNELRLGRWSAKNNIIVKVNVFEY